MVDQHEALAVITGLTDTVYLVRPTGIQTINPWICTRLPGTWCYAFIPGVCFLKIIYQFSFMHFVVHFKIYKILISYI
jgi:hypothetical protein